AKGVIDVSVGDTILIELKARSEVRDFLVSESPVLDTAQLTKLSPVNTSGEKHVLKYNITTATGEWLYVFCNEELALRYKLNVKKEIAKAND
ncbi:MAG TPA: hypothetical protein VIS75_16850, partial [Chitinophagaceae bacterium]